ncbi:hypothetical protein BLNAU_19877 [Blattamonas nauphoetae]|uniref:Uncharacterized protein n=1 Tax=Blattamonas nauphoetae TaxID=2049346 RepID=A0ABQ9X095_9EUKA|nr:hypothetical protein BLNAU_19877 [Blattamonas nauphoetae]
MGCIVLIGIFCVPEWKIHRENIVKTSRPRAVSSEDLSEKDRTRQVSNPGCHRTDDEDGEDYSAPIEAIDTIRLCLKFGSWKICPTDDNEGVKDDTNIFLCRRRGKWDSCFIDDDEAQDIHKDRKRISADNYPVLYMLASLGRRKLGLDLQEDDAEDDNFFDRFLKNTMSRNDHFNEEKETVKDERLTLCLKNNQWSVCPSTDEDHEDFINVIRKNHIWSVYESPDEENKIKSNTPVDDVRFIRLCQKNRQWSVCEFSEQGETKTVDLVVACRRDGKWGVCPENNENDFKHTSEDDDFLKSLGTDFIFSLFKAAEALFPHEDERLRLCLKNKKWTVCPSTDEDHEGFVNICQKNDRWSLCQSPDKESQMMFDAPVEDSSFITLCHKNGQWSVCTDSDVTDELDIVDFVVTCLRRGKWGRCSQKEEDDIPFPSELLKAFDKCIENAASTLRNFAKELFRFEDKRLRLCLKNKKWSICTSTDDDHEGFVNICQKNEKWTICKSPDEKDEAKDNTPTEDMGIINLCQKKDKWSVCHSVKDKEEADATSFVVACLSNGQWGRCLPAEEEHFKIHSEDEGIFQMCLKNKKWSLCHPPTEGNLEGVIMLYYMNGKWSVCHPTDAEDKMKDDKDEKWSAYLYNVFKEDYNKISPVEDTDVFKLCLKNGKWSVCLSAEEEKEADDIAVFTLCRRKGIWLLHLTAEQERSRYLRHESRMMKFLERTLSFDN